MQDGNPAHFYRELVNLDDSVPEWGGLTGDSQQFTER